MKKRYLLSLLFSFALITSSYSQHAFLEQDVIDALLTTDANELLPIMIEMDDMVDIKALNKNFKTNKVPVDNRAQIVMEQLKAKANSTQPAVVSFIESSGLQYENIQRLWISNIISLEASPELISNLANLESVGRIALDMPQFGLIKPEKGTVSAEKSVGGVEPGLVAIGAPEMWAMGYTGQSRLALTFDTGCWTDHPAFKNRYLVNRMPLQSTWFGYDSPVPVDKSDGHGTHVSGTMLGLDTATADTIGSAMNAYLIATDPIVQDLADVKSLSEILLGYEWAMNPDGDETTSADIPDVINNSWGRDNSVIDQDWSVCPELFAPTMEAVEAAGIANVFSAGNEGPNPETIGVPHNLNAGLVNSFTVAAVNGNVTANWPVADFSSRGPSLCGGEGSLLIKPEVSAPGVNVRSSVGGGEYDVYSGTSMASPHVCGAILLLKEAFPYLSGEDLLLALYYSATDLGNPGEDNTYGMGMINVKAAYDYLAETNEPVPPAVHTTDIELVSILSPSETLTCINPFENSEVSPIVVVQNNGENEITGIEIHYAINGQNEMTYIDPDLVMASGSDTELALPAIAADADSSGQELHVWITPIDGEYDTFNNHNVFRWRILPVENFNSNITENFEEGIADTWTITNPDGSVTWDTIPALQPNGEEGISAWMDFNSYNPIASQHDDLITPMLYYSDTDGSFESIDLSFDLFYRKRSNNDYIKDTLAVFVKQDCGTFGESYFEVFRQGGDSLYTVLDGAQSALPQNSDEWRHVEITVPIVGNNSNPYFYFKFEAINRRGNNLLLDNINIHLNSFVGISENEAPQISLYPNPTSNSFTLVSEGIEKAESLDIFDVFGRKIAERKIHSRREFDVSALAKGIYLVRVYWNDGVQSAVPLVIE